MSLLDENRSEDADDDLVPVLDLRQRVVKGVQVGSGRQNRILHAGTSKRISCPETRQVIVPYKETGKHDSDEKEPQREQRRAAKKIRKRKTNKLK